MEGVLTIYKRDGRIDSFQISSDRESIAVSVNHCYFFIMFDDYSIIDAFPPLIEMVNESTNSALCKKLCDHLADTHKHLNIRFNDYITKGEIVNTISLLTLVDKGYGKLTITDLTDIYNWFYLPYPFMENETKCWYGKLENYV